MSTVAAVLDDLSAGRGCDVRALSDDACAEAAGRGGEEAFAELVRRYQGRIYGYLSRMVGCPEEARDLTQETFLNAYRRLPEWEPRAPFRTWLFRIAGNAAIDRLRRRRVHDPVPLEGIAEPADGAPAPEQQLHSRRRFAYLEQALRALPEAFRQPLLLRELEGMAYSEIALTLEIAEGTVKSRIARARAQLLSLFERGGYR